jgi:hypothetical protein
MIGAISFGLDVTLIHLDRDSAPYSGSLAWFMPPTRRTW